MKSNEIDFISKWPFGFHRFHSKKSWPFVIIAFIIMLTLQPIHTSYQQHSLISESSLPPSIPRSTGSRLRQLLDRLSSFQKLTKHQTSTTTTTTTTVDPLSLFLDTDEHVPTLTSQLLMHPSDPLHHSDSTLITFLPLRHLDLHPLLMQPIDKPISNGRTKNLTKLASPSSEWSPLDTSGKTGASRNSFSPSSAIKETHLSTPPSIPLKLANPHRHSQHHSSHQHRPFTNRDHLGHAQNTKIHTSPSRPVVVQQITRPLLQPIASTLTTTTNRNQQPSAPSHFRMKAHEKHHSPHSRPAHHRPTSAHRFSHDVELRFRQSTLEEDMKLVQWLTRNVDLFTSGHFKRMPAELMAQTMKEKQRQYFGIPLINHFTYDNFDKETTPDEKLFEQNAPYQHSVNPSIRDMVRRLHHLEASYHERPHWHKFLVKAFLNLVTNPMRRR